jgi:hypothetical protein
MKYFLACVMVLALDMPALAQVYKWVDANGVTHYSERPQEKSKAKELNLRDASPRQTGNGATSPSLSDRELDFRKRQATRAQEETQTTQEKAQRESKCRAARASLTDLKATNRVYERNESGERVFMNDAQRDALIAKREAEYKQYCG